MAARYQQPPARAARQDPPTATGRDDRTEKALARSHDLRRRSDQLLAKSHHLRQAQASRRRRRAGPGSPRSSLQRSRLTRDPYEQLEYATATRARLAARAADLADTEESLARLHDRLAAKDPKNAAQYRRAADEARHAARRIREFQRIHS